MPLGEVIGHRPLVALLARAAARDTLPPSLIFAGPEGVGKRTTAVALAQALNCLQPVPWTGGDEEQPGREACGACAACRRIARGVHADVHVLVPGETGSIRIAEVRDLVQAVGYRPFEGRRRLVMIDRADALVPEAQNALLKTLEEPPPASVFILITARPDVLLPTVLSRCPRLRFGPLAPSEVADLLVRVHGLTPADARAAAAAADGSLAGALAGVSGPAAGARDAARSVLEEVAGGGGLRARLDGAKLLVGRSADRQEMALRLRALASLLRDLEILASCADERLLANADLTPGLRVLLRSFDSGRAARAFSAVDRAQGALERNASPKIVADWLAFQL